MYQACEILAFPCFYVPALTAHIIVRARNAVENRVASLEISAEFQLVHSIFLFMPRF